MKQFMKFLMLSIAMFLLTSTLHAKPQPNQSDYGSCVSKSKPVEIQAVVLNPCFAVGTISEVLNQAPTFVTQKGEFIFERSRNIAQHVNKYKLSNTMQSNSSPLDRHEDPGINS